MSNSQKYDLIIIGAGASGLMAAISASRRDKKVLIVEHKSKVGLKLLSTGGGSCNITNTLSNDIFMERFGRNGRFMKDSLDLLDSSKLRDLFKEIGLETHSPDGMHVFPTSHKALSVLNVLLDECKKNSVEIKTDFSVKEILVEDNKAIGIKGSNTSLYSNSLILATGGRSYPQLGSDGSGYSLAEKIGHKIITTYPSAVPLLTKEEWVKKCTSNTLGKVEISVDHKKLRNQKFIGDLIFTKNGIAGPVTLELSRFVTPQLANKDELGIIINLISDMNENSWLEIFKGKRIQNNSLTISQVLEEKLPKNLIKIICTKLKVDPSILFVKINGNQRDQLAKLLCKFPLTITDSEGFDNAIVTKGGISLKEINPKTLESKLVKNLFFAGEVIDLDGPCGGFNLQWVFSSGYLVGTKV